MKIGKHGKPLIGTEIFTFREGKHWIATWRRFDVVAQGDTEHEAFARLVRTIAFQAIEDAKKREGNLKRFGSCARPSELVLQRWKHSHSRTHDAN
ncbi:MAG: hypothetical protein ACLP1X_27065 [Polyangiaceae bacterium]